MESQCTGVVSYYRIKRVFLVSLTYTRVGKYKYIEVKGSFTAITPN